MDILGIAGNVLFSAAVLTIKDLLIAAVKSGADLYGANGKKQKTAAMKVFSDLYRYEVWAVLFEDGSRWIRMGCLWKSLEKWEDTGIRKSNLSEFPDDGSGVCEERVAAFEFAKAAVLRMKLPESVEVAQ